MRKVIREILQDAAGTGWVMEPQAKRLLRESGLPTTAFVWVRTEDRLLPEAHKIGFPLVAKVVSPLVVHKTEVGGVIAGIGDEAALAAAYRKLARLDGFDGVLLDRMEHGMEMIVGSRNDPQFGPVVMVGIGGTAVEVYSDVVIRMAPLKREKALAAVDALHGAALLKGHRGAEPVNAGALADLIADFSRLAWDLRETVDTIDLNPVFCNADRAVIADARVMLHAHGA